MVDATFERLTSARLVLRRFRADDIETFVRYRADPAIARFRSWGNFSAADGQAFFASLSGQHPDTPGEWFQFAIELAATAAMMGDCALHALADAPGEVEIGFTLAPSHHGRGYASEAVSCLLDYIFGSLDKQRAIAITDARNAASIAVLERLGFVRDTAPREPVMFKGEPCDEHLYSIRREDWLARRRL
jgi:RimJ/RimL family protein N-acetyltransferase